MEMVYDLLKITIPGILILYTAYLMVRSFMQKQLDESLLSIRHKNQETVLPIRLQAYERVTLLLERISPNNLIPRLNDSELTPQQLQVVLVNEIRSEYNHNLSQQVYMSDEAWMHVSGSVESLISLINEVGNELTKESTNMDLARMIFERNLQNEDSVMNALKFVKAEIRELF